MHDGAEYHYAAIVALALVALGLEIKYFDCAVLAGHKEPLVLPLELHCDGVARQPVEGHLLALLQISHVEDLNESVGASTNISLILTED